MCERLKNLTIGVRSERRNSSSISDKHIDAAIRLIKDISERNERILSFDEKSFHKDKITL